MLEVYPNADRLYNGQVNRTFDACTLVENNRFIASIQNKYSSTR